MMFLIARPSLARVWIIKRCHVFDI
jgi:hypothetical protein